MVNKRFMNVEQIEKTFGCVYIDKEFGYCGFHVAENLFKIWKIIDNRVNVTIEDVYDIEVFLDEPVINYMQERGAFDDKRGIYDSENTAKLITDCCNLDYVTEKQMNAMMTITNKYIYSFVRRWHMAFIRNNYDELKKIKERTRENVKIEKMGDMVLPYQEKVDNNKIEDLERQLQKLREEEERLRKENIRLIEENENLAMDIKFGTKHRMSFYELTEKSQFEKKIKERLTFEKDRIKGLDFEKLLDENKCLIKQNSFLKEQLVIEKNRRPDDFFDDSPTPSASRQKEDKYPDDFLSNVAFTPKKMSFREMSMKWNEDDKRDELEMLKSQWHSREGKNGKSSANIALAPDIADKFRNLCEKKGWPQYITGDYILRQWFKENE